MATVTLAFGLDLAVAEPPRWLHPVSWFGRAVAPADRAWGTPRLAGLALAASAPLAAAGLAAGLVTLGLRVHPAAGVLCAGLVLFSATSYRRLLVVAREVIAATDSDLDCARTRLRALAGRDAAGLSAGEIRSAAIESTAENLADGFTAPLAAFVVLAPVSLAAAAGGAAWAKAVNTLDSMVGYPSKPVGWASARLDDLLMWVPARLTALLLALAAGDVRALQRARRWAHEPSSPNSGWPMATLATVLGVRLEKPGAYTLCPEYGHPDSTAAENGVTIASRAGLLGAVLAGGLAWL